MTGTFLHGSMQIPNVELPWSMESHLLLPFHTGDNQWEMATACCLSAHVKHCTPIKRRNVNRQPVTEEDHNLAVLSITGTTDHAQKVAISVQVCSIQGDIKRSNHYCSHNIPITIWYTPKQPWHQGGTMYCSHSITWIQLYYTWHLDKKNFFDTKTLVYTTEQTQGVSGWGNIDWGKLSSPRTLVAITSCTSISSDECLPGYSQQVVVPWRWLVWSSIRFFSQVDTSRPVPLYDTAIISYKHFEKMFDMC
jgi:hypothetical protein